MGAFSVFSLMVQPHVLAGTLGLVSQELDVPHSYTSIGDAARTLAAAVKDERAFGRAWHAPTVTLSVRQLAVRLAELAGAPEPRLEQLTEREVSLLGLTDPFWNELHEVLLTPGLPFVVDYADTERTFGITATPANEVLKELLN